jgi:hypothetical protein
MEEVEMEDNRHRGRQEVVSDNQVQMEQVAVAVEPQVEVVQQLRLREEMVRLVLYF